MKLWICLNLTIWIAASCAVVLLGFVGGIFVVVNALGYIVDGQTSWTGGQIQRYLQLIGVPAALVVACAALDHWVLASPRKKQKRTQRRSS